MLRNKKGQLARITIPNSEYNGWYVTPVKFRGSIPLMDSAGKIHNNRNVWLTDAFALPNHALPGQLNVPDKDLEPVPGFPIEELEDTHQPVEQE